MRVKSAFLSVVVTLFTSLAAVPTAFGMNLSTTPRFLLPELWTLGVETDIVFQTNSAGLGVQGRFTHGFSDLMNLGGFVGTGAGGRGFKFGGQASFDFFPESKDQLGVGVGSFLGYASTTAGAAIDFRVIPYIHRKITSKRNEIEPFGAISFGPTFGAGGTVMGASAIAGGIFEVYQQLLFTMELGVAIANESTTLSGGLTYFAK